MKKSLLLLHVLFTLTFANAQLSGYYKQGFEDTTFPPQGWKTINVSGFNVWHRQADSLHDANPAAASGQDGNFDTEPGINYLVTPQFAVKTSDSLTFQLCVNLGGGNDTLSVLVSTSSSDIVDFNSVLATFNNYPNSSNYTRKSFSLSKFTGKKIYITFKHSAGTHGADVFIDDVTLGTPPPKDIKVSSIDLRTYLSTDSTITPKVTFLNEGSEAQTFNVTLTAGSYTSTKTITSLLPQYSRQVSFDKLTLPSTPANILFIAYASLPDDANNSDDTIIKQCTTINHFTNQGWIKAQDITGDYLRDNAVTCYSSGTKPDDSSFIFSIGGIIDFGGYADPIAFNLKTKTWIYGYPATLPRFYAGGHAFTYKNKVFYIGGSDGGSPNEEPTDVFIIKKVLIYDLTTNKWDSGLSAPVPLGSYAGCQYHDSLYYVIGVDTSRVTNLVFVYNAASNTWAPATDFPGTASMQMGAGIINNTIVTAGGLVSIGGFFATQKLLAQAYKGIIDPDDPTKISWSKIDDYPGGPTATIIAASINDPNLSRVYFTGGYDSTIYRTPKKETYAYNISTNHWEIGPDKPTAASALLDFAPFVFHDTLYIASIGGISTPDDSVPKIIIPNEWLAIGPVSGGVLAEHLMSFTATLQNNKTILNWKVSEDGIGGYYVIQRAADAVHFTDILQNISAGKGSGVKSYIDYDASPLKDYNYYRIKIVNADGSIFYSPIKAVNNIWNNITASIYPNPTHELVNVTLQNNSSNNATVSIAIADIAGRRIINETKTVNSSLNLSYNLKPGTYIINLTSKDGMLKESQKIVVE